MRAGSVAGYRRLDGLAGAIRFVWNHLLGENKKQFAEAIANGTEKPSTSSRAFTQRFTALRNEPAFAWLQDHSSNIVCKTVAERLPQAFAAFHRNRKIAAAQGKPLKDKKGRLKWFPGFKSKFAREYSFDLHPGQFKVQDGCLYIQKLGWMTLERQGGDPYAGDHVIKAICRCVAGRWTATVVYRLPVQPKPDNGVVVGVDRNGGQYAYAASTGETGMVHQQKSKTLEARRKRYQRKLARQLEAAKKRAPRHRQSGRMQRTMRRLSMAARKIAHRRKHDNHIASKTVAKIGGTVVMENLNIKGMTASAKGTLENPGKHVKAKSGTNRVVLATGWLQCAHFTGYKAAHIDFVPARHTSLDCNVCGHRDRGNRPSQAHFKCARCGHTDNADINAAKNVLMASEAGATARGGSGVAWPAKRELGKTRNS